MGARGTAKHGQERRRLTSHDETFDLIAGTVPAITGGDADQLLARATHVARNAICITDAELDAPGPRILYVNPAFEQMTGWSRDEVLGRDPRFLQGPLSDRIVLDRLRADLAAGRPFQGETYNYRKDGTPFRMSWRIAAVRDTTGRVTHYVAAQDDVSAVREAEDLLRDHADDLEHDTDWLGVLVDLGVDLARTSDADDVLAKVVQAAVGPLGADQAAVVLVDEERDEWVVSSIDGVPGVLRGSRFDPQANALVQEALDHGRPLFRSESGAAIGAGLGEVTGAAVVVPIGIAAEQGAYGALVIRWDAPRRFRPAERTHLGLLGRLTTMTHRKTQALENQRSLAVELQAALLPDLGDLPGLEASWRYLSVADDAVVGGDWYDAVPLPDGSVALFVGDVAGHGAPAAALMGEVRFTARGLLRAYVEPGELLDELDAALLASHAPGRALATTCAILVCPDGTIRYSGAGHPHPVIRRADGSLDVLDGARSRLLGAATSAVARPTAVDHLGSGDTLVAFSDGVFEVRDLGYDDAYRRLLGRLAAAEDTPDGLCDAAVGAGHHGVDPGAFRDDVVVLAVRRADEPGERVAGGSSGGGNG